MGMVDGHNAAEHQHQHHQETVIDNHFHHSAIDAVNIYLLFVNLFTDSYSEIIQNN